MKQFPIRCCALLAIAIALLSPRLVSAQIFPMDTVTICASDPVAAEAGDTATFEFTRQGPTNFLLNVFYNIGGTASNGVDYATIASNVIIPAGSRSASVVIKPLEDTIVEGSETVELTLAPSPLASPGSLVIYQIGSLSNAVAYIVDDDGSNAPPLVNIFSPASGSAFYAPTNIPLFAETFDAAASVTNVEFFAGTLDLGPGHFLVLDPPGVNGVVGPVYFFNWIGAPVGNYSVTAVAIDDGGNSATSAPVVINVLLSSPVVKITTPTNGAAFVAPLNIPISATAISSNADVTRVQFYADDHFIGADIGVNKAHYDLTWTNPPPGFYTLRAVAFDSNGGKGSSEPVHVSITGTSTPPRHLPVVNISALDPVAVVGTNCVHFNTNGPIASNIIFRALTNTASFVVWRSDDTNSSLDVFYSTSGRATNGVDYATLPGVVTIPAGKRAASIVIYPLGDTVPDCPERVILSLTNAPTYVVGWPDRAAAIIIDCSFAPPATALLCDGAFHFFLPAPTNTPYYRIECSVDMIHWLPVCTNTASEIGIHFTDPQSQNFPSLFYRAIPQANAPLIYP